VLLRHSITIISKPFPLGCYLFIWWTKF